MKNLCAGALLCLAICFASAGARPSVVLPPPPASLSARAETSPAPSVLFYKEVAHAIQGKVPSESNTLSFIMDEGFWVTKRDGLEVLWQIPAGTVCQITFDIKDGRLKGPTVQFNKQIFIFSPKESSTPIPIPRAPAFITYTTGIEVEGVPTLAAKLALPVGSHLNLWDSPEKMFTGTPFLSSMHPFFFGTEKPDFGSANPPVGTEQPMMSRVEYVRPVGGRGYIVTLKKAALHLSQPGTPTLDTTNEGECFGNNCLEADDGATVTFSAISYSVEPAAVSARIDKLELVGARGNLTGNGIRLGLSDISRFALDELTLEADGTLKAASGVITAKIQSGSLSFGEEASLTLNEGSRITLPSLRLAAAKSLLSELSVDRAEMDLRFLFGQLRLGQIGSVLFQGGALQANSLTGTWKEGVPSSATGNIRNLVLPVMGGQLNLNDLTSVSLADRSSISAEQLRLDTGASPNLTGRIGSAFLVLRGERRFSISRWLDFVPKDGTTVIAQDPVFPLTIAINKSFLTGRYLIYGPYKKLNLRSTDIDGTFAEGLADFDIVAKEDKTFSAAKISFDGQIEHLNLPFGSDSQLNLQDGSVKSDQNGLKMELALDRPPRIDNTLTVANSHVAQSDLRFNRASKLRATAGSVEVAHLLFTSQPTQKVTTLLTNFELRFNDPTSFTIPDIATIESARGGSLIADRSAPSLELSSDTPSPVGPYTIDLPSSQITLQGSAAPLIQNGMTRLPLSNGRDGVVTGSGMSIDGNLSANLDAAHVLQGTIKLTDGMLNRDLNASPILEFSLEGTLQPLALGRLKTAAQTLPAGQPKPSEWFFPTDFDVSFVNQSLTSPVRIRLEGNRLSTLSTLPITLSLSVPPGLGKYKDPNNLAKGTKNKGDGKDKQELWRKEIAIKGYHCKESSFLNSTPGPGTSLLNSAVSILNGEILFSFPAGTLPAQATPVTLSGCAKDTQIFDAVSQALFTAINNHRKRDVLTAPVSASDPPDKLFGVFLLLESVNDISSTDQHALRFRIAP